MFQKLSTLASRINKYNKAQYHKNMHNTPVRVDMAKRRVKSGQVNWVVG